MSTVDDLLDFGSSGQHGNSDSNDAAWQASSNVDLLGDFDTSGHKGEFDFTMSSNQEFQDDVANQESPSAENPDLNSDDPFGMRAEDDGLGSLLSKDFGFTDFSGSGSNPFGDRSPFEMEPELAPTEEVEKEAEDGNQEEEVEEVEDVVPEVPEGMEQQEEEEEEEEGEEEEGGPQVTSAIDDQIYYQEEESSSEDEQNFDTIRPVKPVPAKRPSTSAVTVETHVEEEEFGKHDLQEEEEEEEKEEEEKKEERPQEDEEEEEELVEEHSPQEEKEEEEVKDEEAETEDVHSDEDKGQVENSGFHNARDSRHEESADGSGFAYEGHVVVGDSEELLRDPSPELQSSRPIAESSAAFDNLEGGGDEMCRICEKRVYHMERLIADKHVYHKVCFKCSKCKRILSVGNFAVNKDELYCKPHFLENFKFRGRYDDSPDNPTEHERPAPVVREERRVEEPAMPAGDVVRSDEKFDDGISSAPRLSNIRSRFEAGEEAKPEPVAPPRQTRNWKYQEKAPPAPEDLPRRQSEEVREEEMPPENMARSLAAKFREMEASGPAPPKMSPRSERRAGGTTVTDSAVDPDRGVIRGSDFNDVLPEAGTTRSLVSVWRNLESNDQRDGSPPFRRPPPEVVRRPSAQREERSPSTPSPPGEVVRSGEQMEDDLPPPDTTRSMAAIFRALESQGGPPPTPESSKRIQARAREQSGANNTVRLPGAGVNASAYEGEDDGEQQHQRYTNGNDTGGVDESAENDPMELDPDVVRNGDPVSTEELPERGTTRNLLAIFQSMEQTERAVH